MKPGLPRPNEGWRATAPRVAAVLVPLFFLVAASAWILHTNLRTIDSARYGRTDEVHTLVLGIKYLIPFKRSALTLQVGETNRWFARLLYPLGVYWMNAHMGGAGQPVAWRYPGGHYLREHYVRGGGGPAEVYPRDPNVQDFAFFMRSAFSLLAVGAFCLALWALGRRVHPAAAAAYGGLVLGGPVVMEQFRLFYSETSLFILFNLTAFLCLHYDGKAPTYRNAAYLGILSALALSAKLTGALVAVPAFLYVAFNMRGLGRRAAPRIEVFLLFFLSLTALVNAGFASPFEFVNQTLANVWHVKAGHSTPAEEGAALLAAHLGTMEYVAAALFVLAMAWLARSPARGRLVPVYALGAGVALTVWSLADAIYFLARNAAILYVAMSFIAALAAGDLVRRVRAARPRLGAGLAAGPAAALLASGAALVHGLPPLDEEFFARIREPVRQCRDIGAIGLPERDLRTLRGLARGGVDALPRVRPPFVLSGEHLESLKRSPWAARFLERRPLDLSARIAPYDCLAALREGQTKQITNFLAPKGWTLEARVGDRFFFARSGQ